MDARNALKNITRCGWECSRQSSSPGSPAPQAPLVRAGRYDQSTRVRQRQTKQENERDHRVANELCSTGGVGFDRRKHGRVGQVWTTQMTLRCGPQFGVEHWSKIATQKNDQGRKGQHQDWVEAIGQAGQERGRRAADDSQIFKRRAERAPLSGDPGRDDRQSRDGSGRRIDQEREFFSGNLQAVRQGTQGLADDQRVGIVVQESEHPEQQHG